MQMQSEKYVGPWRWNVIKHQFNFDIVNNNNTILYKHDSECSVQEN